ncbi:MAG: hypothetical protein HY550_00270 [Elusimicrobia bacterium]|nr:hypothetical protein [Elusimicrobiota bacterium]
MADNSGNRKKTLVVSVLAFLFIGGGVFLFFIIQGSDDLTRGGKKASFSYGSAAREGVSSFFKSLGVIPEEDKKLSEAAVDRLAARGLPLDELGVKDTNPSVSDWMANNSAGSSSSGSSYSGRPTTVPKMSAGAGSPVGGGGAGGTKSQGGVSRFGEGSTAGNTTISAKTQAGGGGPAGKGTMVTLKNARALLGEGLKSDSAMTARSKWGQSFGVGGHGAKSGDMAYKTGLVNLDKIKSGEIASLKMDNKGSLKTTEVGSPVKDTEGTKAALAGDKKVKEDAEAKMKADAIKAAAEAATQAATKQEEKPGDKPGGPPNDGRPPGVSDAAWKAAQDATCGASKGCTTDTGATYTDTNRNFTPNPGPPPTTTVEFRGTQTNPDGSIISYSDTVTYDAKGNLVDLVVVEKPK